MTIKNKINPNFAKVNTFYPCIYAPILRKNFIKAEWVLFCEWVRFYNVSMGLDIAVFSEGADTPIQHERIFIFLPLLPPRLPAPQRSAFPCVWGRRGVRPLPTISCVLTRRPIAISWRTARSWERGMVRVSDARCGVSVCDRKNYRFRKLTGWWHERWGLTNHKFP